MTIGTLDPTKPLLNDPATPGHQELQDIKAAVQATFVGMQANPGVTDIQTSSGPTVDSAVALANTALQAGSNVSLLTNDADYQSGAQVDSDIAAGIQAHENDSGDPHSAAGYAKIIDTGLAINAAVDAHDQGAASHADQDWQDSIQVTTIAAAVVNSHNNSSAAHGTAFAAHNVDALAHSTEFARYQLLAEKGLANGYASLDATGRVPTAQLPAGSGSMAFGCEIDLSATPTFVNAPAGWTIGYSLGTVTVNFNGNIPAGATAAFVSLTHRDPTPLNNTKNYVIENMSTTLFTFVQYAPSTEIPTIPPIDNVSCVVVFI